MELKPLIIIFITGILLQFVNIISQIPYIMNYPLRQEYIFQSEYDPIQLFELQTWWVMYLDVVPWVVSIGIFVVIGYVLRNEIDHDPKTRFLQKLIEFWSLLLGMVLPLYIAMWIYDPRQFYNAADYLYTQNDYDLSIFEIAWLRSTYHQGIGFDGYPQFLLYLVNITNCLEQVLLGTVIILLFQYFFSRSWYPSSGGLLFPEKSQE